VVAAPGGRPGIPSLGSRGQGWVVLQLVCLAGAGIAGWLFAGPSSDAALVVGFGLIVAGAVVVASGLLELQRAAALTPLPYPRPEGRLVESGAYRFVRHPVYGGLILMTVGWAALRASTPAFLAAIALAVVFDLKRRREEAWLQEQHPGYRAYQRRTRALIPGIY
jgi:protein-S-isoprenylcysteine O-methyltransferase Ste14